MPYGRDKISRGDRIFCVGIERGELRLITRLRAAVLDADTLDEDLLYIDDAEDEYVEADFDRVVPGHVLDTLKLIYADGSEHPIRRDAAGRVEGNAYEGRSSIRELAAGTAELDALL